MRGDVKFAALFLLVACASGGGGPIGPQRTQSSVLIRNNATAVPDIWLYTPYPGLVGELLPGGKVCISVTAVRMWMEARDGAFYRSTPEIAPLEAEGWTWELTASSATLGPSPRCGAP